MGGGWVAAHVECLCRRNPGPVLIVGVPTVVVLCCIVPRGGVARLLSGIALLAPGGPLVGVRLKVESSLSELSILRAIVPGVGSTAHWPPGGVVVPVRACSIAILIHLI